jgi:hypothetical protein
VVFLQSITQTRGYAQKGVNNSAMAIQARQKAKLARQKKHKPRTSFKTYDLKDAEKFALCDAMRSVCSRYTRPFCMSANEK